MLYRLTIRNTGNGVTAPLLFADQPDAATPLVAGSVQTSQGQVLVGNNPGDRTIQIDLGRIAPGERVQISYRVCISNGAADLRIFRGWFANLLIRGDIFGRLSIP